MAQQNSMPVYPSKNSNWQEQNTFNNMNPAMDQTYNDPNAFNDPFFDPNMGLGDPAQQGGGGIIPPNQGQYVAPQQSQQLVRRDRNQHLAPLDKSGWDDVQVGTWEHSDDDADLDAQAMAAKKDAQAKRKQIPPFVQKLSSFLDEKRNTDLIRWSDDGTSFIVLNEDEFAKTLIPELFKHNNYASFVRQLNMYGFHKKVGLSDNSMKSSEQKVKNPSEYYNKYFRRGRPELLWLIQKPKNSTTAKRKREDEKIKPGDSDEEPTSKFQLGAPARQQGEEDKTKNSNEMAVVPMKEISGLRSELHQVQQQQKIITNYISRMRQQNEQLFQQASQFQQLHDRHENSINAILTFLATIYNRQMDGGDAQNIVQNMFANTQSQMHGNVVDVEDYQEDGQQNQNNQNRQTPRRKKQPLALLPPPQNELGDAASPATVNSSSRATSVQRSPPPLNRQNSIFKNAPPAMRRTVSNQRVIPPSGPPAPAPSRQTNSDPAGLSISSPNNDDIVSVINNTNANADLSGSQGPKFDFSAALNHFQNANGNSPLTPEQRSNMLNLMAASNPQNTGDTANAAATSGANNVNAGGNALVSPNPPPVPNITNELQNRNADIDVLEKLQRENDDRLSEINTRLQPFSPSGNIPGLGANDWFGGAGGNPGGEHGGLDIDNYIEPDYFTNADPNTATAFSNDMQDPNPATAFPTTETDANDLGDLSNFDFSQLDNNNLNSFDPNFGFDNSNAAQNDPFAFAGGNTSPNLDPQVDWNNLQEPSGPGRVESVSSNANSPADGIMDESSPTTGPGQGGRMDTRMDGSPKKKRRKS